MAEENFAKSLQKFQEILGQTKLNIEKLNRFAKILQAQNRLVQVKKIGARKLKQKTILNMPTTKIIRHLFVIQESIAYLTNYIEKCEKEIEKINNINI